MKKLLEIATGGHRCSTSLRRVGGGVLLALAVLTFSRAISYGQDQAPRQKKPIINFREPERVYQTVKGGEWSFEIEKHLIADAPDVAQLAVKRLEVNLNHSFRLLPKPTQQVLKELKFFVMYGPRAHGGGHENGLEYCARNAPEFRQHLDPRWSRCIVIYCAENYATISDLWALKSLIHELGHAHHKENWPEKQPDIMAAWENAMNLGLYSNVMDDKGKVLTRTYAQTNQLEYFAELTAMYFARCNYSPFNRSELRRYDPIGFMMVEKMWGLSKNSPPPPKKADATR